ncbi:hypothetical protein [Aeromonas salmonicida]|uniref:hypothetical protein n=1 Tax=Aeromonas salmonicida TaxID=645 RepID=UPI003CEDC200
MHPTRVSLLLVTLLLGGCAAPGHQQLGTALSGLEGELQRLEEELAAMNGLHYQKAIDAPLSLRRHLVAASPPVAGARLERRQLQDGMTALPLDNPCLRYEFELRHLGRLGQLALSWQGRDTQGSRLIHQRDCPFSASGPGLQ